MRVVSCHLIKSFINQSSQFVYHAGIVKINPSRSHNSGTIHNACPARYYQYYLTGILLYNTCLSCFDALIL